MASSVGPQSGGPPDRLWPLRWWLLGSGALVLAALLFVMVELSLGWRWSLFWWGLALGVISVVGINAAVNVLLRADPSRPRRSREVRVMVERRRLIYSGAWLLVSLEVGMAAAIFNQPGLDIALAAGLGVLAVAAAIMLPVLKRRHQS